MKGLCGIDEAGRGALAGDLAICGVMFKKNIKGLKDSKQISPKKREVFYEQIIKNSVYHKVFISAKDIDELGLSKCFKIALEEIMSKIPAKTFLFDGNTNYKVQNLECKIKADESVAEVSAASILAKVSRDADMIKLSKIYPVYGFEKHKGYGTKAHIQAIKNHGLSKIHRKSFRLKALEFKI